MSFLRSENDALNRRSEVHTLLLCQHLARCRSDLSNPDEQTGVIHDAGIHLLGRRSYRYFMRRINLYDKIGGGVRHTTHHRG